MSDYIEERIVDCNGEKITIRSKIVQMSYSYDLNPRDHGSSTRFSIHRTGRYSRCGDLATEICDKRLTARQVYAQLVFDEEEAQRDADDAWAELVDEYNAALDDWNERNDSPEGCDDPRPVEPERPAPRAFEKPSYDPRLMLIRVEQHRDGARATLEEPTGSYEDDSEGADWLGVAVYEPSPGEVITDEQVREILKGEVHMYSSWLSGDVYEAIIEGEDGGVHEAVCGIFPDEKGDVTYWESELKLLMDEVEKRLPGELSAYRIRRLEEALTDALTYDRVTTLELISKVR